jgi:small-conductance mechanosensitive channel
MTLSTTHAATDTGVRDWAAGAATGLAAIVGPWINDEIAFGIRWRTLAACIAVLVLVGVADAILRWLVRRKIRRDEATAETTPGRLREARYWLGRALRATVPPLELLLWIHGVHAALAIVLAALSVREEAAMALAALSAVRGVGTLAGMFWLLYRLGRVLEDWLGRLSVRTGSAWDLVLIPLAGKTARLTLPLVALILGVPALPVSADLELVFKNAVSLVLIGTVALVLLELVNAAEAFFLRHYRLDARDNLQARKIYTQVTVLKKVAIVIIGIFTLASMLMVFDSVRQFGTSILASAGIAGIIIGFAAQRSIATLLAGFQIAFTQPIRIDDVVIVENEWGRIEVITLTYVTVRIWDMRRLILPITYFIEQPFQNWTRTSSEILGTVFLYVDYTMPLQPLREELDRILEASKAWDRKVKVLQVTAAKEHTLELRVLASAADASLAWDLRCEIREKLVTFVQQHYPEHLPRMRAELQPSPAGDRALGHQPSR